MVTPGLKIAACRIQKGWTQGQLSARASIAQANLSNIEKGKKDFTVSTLLRIAAALEVDPTFFLQEEPASQKTGLTRNFLETLASAIAEPERRVPLKIRKEAALFNLIFMNPGKYFKVRDSERAWYQIRQKYSSQEIQTIRQRVEDARMRQRAKTAD